MNHANIAGLHIEYSIVDTVFFNARLSRYASCEIASRDMLMRTTILDHIDPPQGELVKQIKSATIVQTSDGRIARSMMDRESGQVAAIVWSKPDYSEVDIHLWKHRHHPVFSLTDYEYMYTGFAFNDRLTYLDGAVLHGSALAINNEGIIFSANSGVGKSTHANLWKQCFKDEVTIVNDDKPALRFLDGKPYMFGTPWSGKTDLNTNVQVPLKAIVFIKRANNNAIERLNPRESMFALSSQIERPYYDSQLGMKTLDVIEQLISTVPVYRLHCNISFEAVQVVYDNLFTSGGITI